MKKEFKVERVTKSEKSGNFVTKLVYETVVDLDILGMKPKKETYYISAPAEVKAGDTVELELGMFEIVDRPYVFIGEYDEEVTVSCKWLHLK